MTHHIPTLSRRLLVAAMITVLGAAVGIAQPKAEKTPDATAPSQPSLVTSDGVLVVAVEVGSPADKAGIARGDIILSIDGTAVNTPFALRQSLNGKNPGDTVAVKFRHGDAEKNASLGLGTLNGRPWIGLIIEPPGFGMGMGRDFRGRGDNDFVRPAPGALIASVLADSPADKSGLKQGDVIISVDGATVDPSHSLGDLIAAKKVGDIVTLSVLPGGQGPAKDVKVTLEKNPNKDAPYLGLQYTANYPRGLDRGMMGPAAVQGALIVTVEADSPAAKAGIQAGDVITKVAGAAVANPQQVADAVANQKIGDTLVLSVYSRAAGKESDVTVTLGQNPNDASKAFLGVTLRMSIRFGGERMPGNGFPRGQSQRQFDGVGRTPPTTL